MTGIILLNDNILKTILEHQPRNCRSLIFTNLKEYRTAATEKIERIESMAEAFGEMSKRKDLEFFCIGEKTLYETFVGMLTADNAPIEDVIRIREKQFAAIERVMVFAESDDVHKEQIKTTYKTDDLISWHLNRLLYSPHPQFAKLRKNPKYMEMLSKWSR